MRDRRAVALSRPPNSKGATHSNVLVDGVDSHPSAAPARGRSPTERDRWLGLLQEGIGAGALGVALAFPDAIVASDAMPVLWVDGSYDSREWPLPPGGSTHPRTAGTFTRTLKRMVRETGAWTWVEAFRRCSWLPARLLDDVAPAARGKGWLGPGADADLVVLDPTAVTDVATYLDPARPSTGVRHLLVAGTPVIRDGALLCDAYPGRALRGQH